MPLKVKNSCEIDDLIDEICSVSGKRYDEVETALISLGIYPESTKTYIRFSQDGTVIVDFSMKKHPELTWVDEALQTILKAANIQSVYITHAI